MQSARRPVFFLKDHQAGSKEICETERTNCQPGSQSRMTAFHSPPSAPPPPPPRCSSSCLFTHLSSSSPFTGHNYSMKNDFPKQHRPTLYPLIRVEGVNLTTRTSTGDFRGGNTIGFLLLCSQNRDKVKVTSSCIFIC